MGSLTSGPTGIESHPWRERLVLGIATGGCCGYSPVVPATVGSFAALLVFIPLAATPVFVQILLSGAVFCLGVYASGRAESVLRAKDARPIVVDEIVGMWLALINLPVRLDYFLAAFVLFRVFDIVKPFPARRAESLSRGWGVMTDDAVAGIYANAALHVLSLQTFLAG